MCSTNTINVFIVSGRNVKYGHRIPGALPEWVSDLRQRKRASELRYSFSLSRCPRLHIGAHWIMYFRWKSGEIRLGFNSKWKHTAIANYITVYFHSVGGNSKREMKAIENAPDGFRRRCGTKANTNVFDKFCACYNYMVWSSGCVDQVADCSNGCSATCFHVCVTCAWCAVVK